MVVVIVVVVVVGLVCFAALPITNTVGAPEKRTIGKTGSWSTKSGAGEPFLPLNWMFMFI